MCLEEMNAHQAIIVTLTRLEKRTIAALPEKSGTEVPARCPALPDIISDAITTTYTIMTAAARGKAALMMTAKAQQQHVPPIMVEEAIPMVFAALLI